MAIAPSSTSVAASRAAGWVGWAGTVESYPLCTHGADAILRIGVAPSAACGRLGHLHAGSVWNGAVQLAQLIEGGFLRERLRGCTVLELGAGAGLPSLVALAAHPADAPRCVVLTDFDDAELVCAMEENLVRNAPLLSRQTARVVGFTWGEDPARVLEAAAELDGTQRDEDRGYDIVLVADCLWNSEPYEGLLQALRSVLRPSGEVWMAHCHHWPGHDADDRLFFGRAAALGLRVERWEEETGRRFGCLFEDDEDQECFVHRLSFADRAGEPRRIPQDVL